MKLSIEDQDNISKIYVESVLMEDMTAGGVVGGVPTSGGSLENVDGYATGDTRIPKVLGGVQTRKGLVKKSKKRKKVKNSRS